jgi:carbonic anhydrase
MSISTDELIQRNARFAASGASAGLPFPTSQTLRVVGCVDSRVDPSHVLGLELGEAVVMRNIGGRVTPATLRSWALLGRLGQGRPPTGAHMVIMHHTDCGIRRLADYPEQLAAYFEIPVADLDSKAVCDPYAAVRVDVGIARQALPAGLLVSGLRREDRARRGGRPARDGVAACSSSRLLRTTFVWRSRGRSAETPSTRSRRRLR